MRSSSPYETIAPRWQQTDVRRNSGRAIGMAVLCAALAAASCGKKGPPIAPIVRIPAPVELITASRFGSDVYITLTVPAKNVDGSLPADIDRIEVYGYTGRVAPLKTRWVELSDRIATIPVVPPPFPERAVPLPEPGVIDPDGAVQGMSVTVHDALTPDELVQGRVPPPVVERRPRTPLPAALTPPIEPPLRR